METFKRICPECGKEFVTSRPMQVVCSLDCQYARRNHKQREYRQQKQQTAQLASIVLKEQSERIAQLEQELGAANKKLAQKPVSNPETEGALRCTISDLSEQVEELKKDKESLNETIFELQEQIRVLNEENKKNKRELQARIEELKKVKNTKTVNGITLDHCDRMNLDAMKLPCGLRAECFVNKLGQPDKCVRNPKKDMKDVIEPGEKIKDRGILEDEND